MTELPPVPKKLRDMLSEYPECLQALQETLVRVANKKPSATPPFERAIWALEDALDGFAVDAGEELKAAEATGDPAAISRAESKRSTFSSARLNMGAMTELHDYFSAQAK